MSLWIEIHCDVQCDNPPGWYEDKLRSFCLSQRGDSVGALFRNQDLRRAMLVLAGIARNSGWVKTRKHGWACPNCAKMLKEKTPKD